MGTRTGIRSGVAPSDVWHVMGNGRATLCGRVRVKAAVRVKDAPVAPGLQATTLERVERQVTSQGGTVCEKCRTRCVQLAL
jgi:hypothetical protein